MTGIKFMKAEADRLEEIIVGAMGQPWMDERYRELGVAGLRGLDRHVRRFGVLSQLSVALESLAANEPRVTMDRIPTAPKKPATAPTTARPTAPTAPSATSLHAKYRSIENPVVRGQFWRTNKAALIAEGRAATAQAKGPSAEGMSLLEQYGKLTGGAKVAFFRQHKTELVKAARAK